jgi:hypothetical protein
MSKSIKNTDNNNQQCQSLYSLQNKDNYKTNFQTNILEIMSKYEKLIVEYLLFIIENISTKNSTYNKFIIIRGLTTITHVFSTLLYYSNNLDMAYYHSQKSFYFYVEFIGQISEDQHSFLQLSSRDASVFVYKKTIFEAPNELIKIQETLPHSEIKVNILEMFDLYKHIIAILFKKIIENIDFNNSFEDKKLYLIEYIKTTEDVTKKIGQSIISITHLKNIIYFMQQIEKCSVDNMNYLIILSNLLKKYFKCNNYVNNKIHDISFQEKLEETINNSDKFIDMLLC